MRGANATPASPPPAAICCGTRIPWIVSGSASDPPRHVVRQLQDGRAPVARGAGTLRGACGVGNDDVKAGIVMNTKFLVSLGSTLAASRLAQGISNLETDDVLRVVGLARRRNYFIENLALVGAGALAGAAVA